MPTRTAHSSHCSSVSVASVGNRTCGNTSRTSSPRLPTHHSRTCPHTSSSEATESPRASWVSTATRCSGVIRAMPAGSARATAGKFRAIVSTHRTSREALGATALLDSVVRFPVVRFRRGESPRRFSTPAGGGGGRRPPRGESAGVADHELTLDPPSGSSALTSMSRYCAWSSQVDRPISQMGSVCGSGSTHACRRCSPTPTTSAPRLGYQLTKHLVNASRPRAGSSGTAGPFASSTTRPFFSMTHAELRWLPIMTR